MIRATCDRCMRTKFYKEGLIGLRTGLSAWLGEPMLLDFGVLLYERCNKCENKKMEEIINWPRKYAFNNNYKEYLEYIRNKKIEELIIRTKQKEKKCIIV